jgi:hypothetical protein
MEAEPAKFVVSFLSWKIGEAQRSSNVQDNLFIISFSRKSPLQIISKSVTF